MRKPSLAALVLLVSAALAGCAGAVRSPRPLHQMAAAGDLRALKEALDGGGDPGAPEPSGAREREPGWAPVRDAWALPYVYRAPPTNKQDLRRTPLHFAAAAGATEPLELLLDRGSAIEARDARGRTALHYAAGFDRDGAVRVLLARGAACGPRDEGGWTPLHVAASQGAAKAAAALLDLCAAADDPTLYYADTPLHLAAFGGHREVAELLLARGANPSARSRLGFTPADLASERRFSTLAEFLEGLGGRGGPAPAGHHPAIP